MRRPNKSGTIIKLNGNRRRPYAIVIYEKAIITADGKVKHKRRYAGYFEKYRDALQELEKFNSSPVKIAPEPNIKRKETFADVYKLAREDFLKRPKTPAVSTVQGYDAAYQKFEPIFKMVFENITVRDYEKVAEQYVKMSPQSVKNMKTVIRMMYKTAIKYQITEKDLSDYITFYATNENANPHTIFTDDEIDALWANKDDFMARLLLIYIYTGMRARELLTMKTEDVHLEERYMVGGSKTDAGKDRQIPIAEKIVPLLDTSGEYLIMLNGRKVQYRYALKLLGEYMEGKPIEHTFHDTRHTCATLLEKNDIPLLHRKSILGHAKTDVTDMYTHVSIEQLIEDINKI